MHLYVSYHVQFKRMWIQKLGEILECREYSGREANEYDEHWFVYNFQQCGWTRTHTLVF